MVRFIQEKAPRKIGTNRRSLTGQVSMRGGRYAVAFESSLERDFVMLQDFDPTVERVISQPICLTFIDEEGERRQYTPDYQVFARSGAVMLYEIKYRSDLREQWRDLRPKFKATIRYCSQRDWRFKIMTDQEIRGTAYLDNVRFLRPYLDRRIDVERIKHLQTILAMLGSTTPQALLEAAYARLEERLIRS